MPVTTHRRSKRPTQVVPPREIEQLVTSVDRYNQLIGLQAAAEAEAEAEAKEQEQELVRAHVVDRQTTLAWVTSLERYNQLIAASNPVFAEADAEADADADVSVEAEDEDDSGLDALLVLCIG